MGQIARRSIEQLDAFSPSELARLMRGYGRLKVQVFRRASHSCMQHRLWDGDDKRRSYDVESPETVSRRGTRRCLGELAQEVRRVEGTEKREELCK
eukprot:4145214-Pleurochrysis_carterae.AAC.5